MPVKRPEDYLSDSQVFLNDQHFRAAIYIASPVFYETLEKAEFETNNLSDREKNTIRKYINRYCYRPTPYVDAWNRRFDFTGGIFTTPMLLLYSRF